MPVPPHRPSLLPGVDGRHRVFVNGEVARHGEDGLFLVFWFEQLKHSLTPRLKQSDLSLPKKKQTPQHVQHGRFVRSSNGLSTRGHHDGHVPRCLAHGRLLPHPR